MGICGELYEWSKSYLEDRRQFTTIGVSKSDLAPVDEGVPQGSLLGPRFYSYHANDLPMSAQVQRPESLDEAKMFADDTTAVTYASAFDQLMLNLQELANQLNKWASLNGMVIHPGKTNHHFKEAFHWSTSQYYIERSVYRNCSKQQGSGNFH